MANDYVIKCPYCEYVYSLKISIILGQVARTNGMREVVKEQKPSSLESMDENNWFDLKDPCPNCRRNFSYNTITGESRE